MYQVGNYVVCKSGGIWKIEEISNGQCKLAEYGTSATADVPVGDDEIVRKIISKEAMLDVISRVGFIRTLQAPNDRIRKEFYEGAMAEYDEIEWIKVIKTVYLRQEEKRLFPGEAELAKKAKKYLHSEISILLDIPFDKVEAYIADSVSSDSW